MTIPALTSFPAYGNPPKLKYTFLGDGSTSLGTITYVGDYLARSNITGTDSYGNGNTQLATILNSTIAHNLEPIYDVQTNPGTGTGTPTDWTSQWNMYFRPSTFPGGIGNELVLNQLTRVNTEWSTLITRPQGGHKITRNQDANPCNTLYFETMMRVPSNLADILDGYVGTFAWMEPIAFKTAASSSNQDGRFSLQIGLKTGETGFRARWQFDTGATPVMVFWTSDSYEGSIVPGKEYLIKIWIDRPAAGSLDIVNGVSQVTMTRLDTNEYIVVADQHGLQFWGASGKPISRIYRTCYTGGFPATGNIEISFSNLKIWDKRPHILIP